MRCMSASAEAARAAYSAESAPNYGRAGAGTDVGRVGACPERARAPASADVARIAVVIVDERHGVDVVIPHAAVVIALMLRGVLTGDLVVHLRQAGIDAGHHLWLRRPTRDHRGKRGNEREGNCG